MNIFKDKKIYIYFSIPYIFLGVLLSATVIYTTPLKWLTIISPKIKNIDPTFFWIEYQKNPQGYLFLDVRDVSAYTNAHADGSISEPIANFYNDYPIFPRDKKIVLICSSGRLAAVAYGYLEHQGFLNLLRIDGGLKQWSQEGLPIIGEPKLIPKKD